MVSWKYFEDKYCLNNDPWHLKSNPYELARYASILEILPNVNYTRAYEPGCSIGVLTELLASRCGQIEASDISKTAVKIAKSRCAGLQNVRFTCSALPANMPSGQFDLILVNELGYYFEQNERIDLADRLVSKLEGEGTLVACHWTGFSVDHLCAGTEVHAIFHEHPRLRHLSGSQKELYLLDVWTRA